MSGSLCPRHRKVSAARLGPGRKWSGGEGEVFNCFLLYILAGAMRAEAVSVQIGVN